MTDASALPSAVLDALHDLTLAYRLQVRAALQALDLPLSPNAWRVLMLVAHQPQCTHTDVVAHTGLDKAQVARLLQHMEAHDWLQRAPHPQDKRSRCLQLSARGTAVMEQLRAQRQQLGLQMLEGTSAAQQTQLLELLQQLHSNLKSLGEAGAAGAPRAAKSRA